MRIEPELSDVVIALHGSFNPAIFTPAWFALHGLLQKNVADNAKLELAHPQLTAFSSEWVHLHVSNESFQIGTQQDPYIRLLDLVLRIAKEHLHHVQLKAIDINRNIHFCVDSPIEWRQITRVLAPIKPWEPVSKELGLNDNDAFGGMVSLTMAQLRPKDRPLGGQIRVTVEPSVRISTERTGIFVGVSDHYAISSADSEERAQLIRFLEEGFELSIKRSDSITNHIMSLVTNQEE